MTNLKRNHGFVSNVMCNALIVLASEIHRRLLIVDKIIDESVKLRVTVVK